jgi:hypothetical protein
MLVLSMRLSIVEAGYDTLENLKALPQEDSSKINISVVNTKRLPHNSRRLLIIFFGRYMLMGFKDEPAVRGKRC